MYHWIRVPAVFLKPEELQNTMRMLSWTAPFAALVVHQLRLALRYDLESNSEDDSLNPQEADDQILTDDGEYNKPNPYKASQIQESSVAGTPAASPVPAPPTNVMLQPLLPSLFPTTPSQPQENSADAIEEFSMDQDAVDPISES
jgi:hypothetical protein